MTPEEIVCQRCGNPGAPGCEHTWDYCPECARFACQSCAAEEAEAVAIEEQRRREWAS